MTFILDAGIVFVLREIMIKLFQDKLDVDQIYAISALLFVLGILRLTSGILYEREVSRQKATTDVQENC